MITCTIERTKNRKAKKIVKITNSFSIPRLDLYNVPEPPNTELNPVPDDCKRIIIINRSEIIIWADIRIVFIIVYQLSKQFLRYHDEEGNFHL